MRRDVATHVNYLLPGTAVNRRFVAPGREVNTGRYAPFAVTVEDARPLAGTFNLDQHGFVLAARPSAVRDFHDKDEVTAVYPGEAGRIVQELTGADLVVTRGWMVRTSGEIEAKLKVVGYQHQAGVQPPAAEAHVDFTFESAQNMARAAWQERFPGQPMFRRFIVTSLWRCFSPPPQDWPLALCDPRSLAADEGVPNTLVVVDEIPAHEEMVGDWPAEKLGASAYIFHHRPGHRWLYFPDMHRDEVLLFKFSDSDRSRAWRVPHTAFHDAGRAGARVRESIELRSIAFFR